MFAVLGFQTGALALLLADLVGELDLTPGELGVALALLCASAMVALAVGGRVADRIGRRPVLVTGFAGLVVWFGALAVVESHAALLAAAVVGGSVALIDLSGNTLGGDYERGYGGRVLTELNGLFSAAAAAGALVAAVAIEAGVSPRTAFACLAALLAVCVLGALRAPLPSRAVEADPTAVAAGALLAMPGVLVPALLVALSFFEDDGLERWVSLYVRDTLGGGPLAGGAALAALYSAGAAARFAAGPIADRFGERRVLVATGFAASAAIVALVASRDPLLAALVLLAVGAFTAPVAPIAYSIVARADPARSGAGAAAVTVFGYGGSVLAPLAVGGVADLTDSLRAGLLAPAAAMLLLGLIALLAPGLGGRPGRRRPA